MAARADCVGVKCQETDRHISWSLEFKGVRRNSPLRLQKWRVVGDGRTAREQIREYATTKFPVSSISNCEEGLNPSRESLFPSSSGSLPPTVEEALFDDRGQSSSVSHPVVEEADAMTAQSAPTGASPFSGSKFTNAESNISGQEDIESEKEELDDDDVQLAVKDAHCFEIFLPDDQEQREPASIVNLEFDCNEDHPPSTKLDLIGFCSRDASGRFMRTIDSWTIKLKEEGNLKMYVRDTKGSWIKLWKPSKKYEGSVHDALIITQFLELAMKSNETNAKRFLDQLVSKIGYRRDEIKAVLLKYYPSVVEKFSQFRIVLPSPRKIINNVESLLKGKPEKFDKGKLVATAKRPSSSDEIKGESNLTSGAHTSVNKRRRIGESDPEIVRDEKVQKERTQAMPTSNKRKRVVQSDSENESDSEDHVPLAQRQFQFSEKLQLNESVSGDEQVDDALNRDELETEYENKKQDQGSRACANLPLPPACNIDDWLVEGVDFQGGQGYQDVAEIYGGESDGLGEIGDDDDDDQEVGDAAFCAICDDGGDLLLCDGPCMRSFHASKDSAAKSESMCRSLGYTAEEVKEMGKWLCLNCLHGQHQCFICGQLGKSEGERKEVFVCDVALCGRFYHPHCLAKYKKEGKYDGVTDPDAFSKSSKEGVEEFCCPAHKCRRCGEGEQEGGVDNCMKLAKCRRCPKAYHKVCLPKRISFEGTDNEPIRAWEIGDEGDPMKRLVMYCLNHEMLERWSTPHRNHLKWPIVSSSIQNIGHKASLNGIANISPPVRQEQKLFKGTLLRQVTGHEADAHMSYQNYHKGPKGSSRQKVAQEDNALERCPLAKADMDSGYSVIAGKDKSTSHTPKREAPILTLTLPPSSKHVDLPRSNDLQKKSFEACAVDRKVPTSTEGRENRVSEIMRQASQNITLETVKERLVQPSCYGENRKKTFLQRGELESMLKVTLTCLYPFQAVVWMCTICVDRLAVVAIRKASEKVKNGGSVEDAKRLCPKELFIRMLKNEDLLKVHLAPILHGMRYTSFGRHFTCTDKLKEIVNRIHPYIDSGDMVVDFCCGANDFSIILNEKLLSTGKTCHFMNFDIHPPKNDFYFTKGDWLTNQGDSFLEGKRLIMGLNPPFGVRAALANRFIRHALTFRPKLLVLIVPPETMSYSNDYKSFNYDLVWEDRELLKGHAFYLPGSVDNNDRENMTQWNVTTPPLYLWSTRDMLQKHRDVAVQCKHIEAPKADALMASNRRTPTPPPPARVVSTLMTSSDKWTNSGSTPTECDTSSSRLQPSSTSSSLADGLSQNFLDGSGPFLPAGVYHALVQNPSYRGQTSGQQGADYAALHQMDFTRPGFVHGSAVHNPPPIPGPLHNNHLQPLPHQHLISAIRHPNVEESPLSSTPSSHSVSPLGNQAPWGQVEQHNAYLAPHHRQSHLDHVHRHNNSHAGHQQWPGLHNLPPSHAAHPVLPPFNHGFQQKVVPNWQAPEPFPGPPAFHLNPPHSGLIATHPPMLPLHSNRYQGVSFGGQPARSDRRPGSSQQGADKASGGWLDA